MILTTVLLLVGGFCIGFVVGWDIGEFLERKRGIVKFLERRPRG